MLKENLDTFEKQRSVHNHFTRSRSNIQKQTLALKGVIINYLFLIYSLMLYLLNQKSCLIL